MQKMMELFSTKKREIQRFFIFFVPISIRSIHFLFRSMFLENSYLIPNRILHHKELNSRKTLQYSKSVSMHLFRCLKHHYGVSFGLSCRENKRISPKKKDQLRKMVQIQVSQFGNQNGWKKNSKIIVSSSVFSRFDGCCSSN